MNVSRRWKFFLLLSLALGLVLRLVYLEDMEFKEDEHYNFIQTQLIGRTDPWPWMGMPSGAFIPNPGLSIWAFVWLARLFRAEDPVALQRAVGLFSVFGLSLVLVFAFRLLKTEREREPWLWTFALAMVNPLAVYYQRKLWPQGFLPFFTCFSLMGWWLRDRFWGAFLWGVMGALVGQMHMAGFFLAAALFGWTLLFGRKLAQGAKSVNWKGWFAGSVLGALPLIPWFQYILQHPTPPAPGSSWSELYQAKYWLFWVSNPLGFHLGNALGVLRGTTHWAHLSDFIRYPLIAGVPTYLNGVAHLAVILIGISGIGYALNVAIRKLWRASASDRKRLLPSLLLGLDSETSFAQNSAFWGCGILLTLTRVVIRRYYLMVSYPLEFLWLTRALLLNPRRGRILLLILWVMQCFISMNLVGYVHVNEGSPQGDYGSAFHVIRNNNLRETGHPWPPRPQNYY